MISLAILVTSIAFPEIAIFILMCCQNIVQGYSGIIMGITGYSSSILGEYDEKNSQIVWKKNWRR